MNEHLKPGMVVPNAIIQSILLRAIKLFLLLLFLSTHVFASAVAAQSVNVKLTLKNPTVGNVIDKLHQQTGYEFSYDAEILSEKLANVSVDVKNERIETILTHIFEKSNISFRVLNNRVFLKNNKVVENTVQAEPRTAQQQGRTVTGTIIDVNGEPVIGATVVVQDDPGRGTVTDIDGNYSLTNVPENATLVISYVGMRTQNIPLAGRSSVNITLAEDTELLEEVVVVGYGTLKKANLTGATTSVNMEDVLGDRPVVNTATALRGTVPGLQITSGTGEPGAASAISIRGATASINGGVPLVLVDNVEMDINMLDPNDIESVTILKDAASAAIYGARAAFGVILITTKKGLNEDRFRVDYSNNFAFSSPRNLPEKASPLQTVSLFKDVGLTNWNNNNIDNWIGLLKEYEANPSAYPNGFATDNGVVYNLREYNSINDMMSSYGFQHTHNLSATGGSQKSSYRMSVGYVNEDGVLTNNKDSYNRYNISGYLTSSAITWLRPELDIKYTSSSRKLPETNATYGIWGSAIAFHSYYPIGTTMVNNDEYHYNSPSYMIEKSYPTTTDIDNIRLAGKITLIPIKNMNIIGEYTINKQFSDKTQFDPIFTYMRAQDNIIENSTTPANSKFYHTNEKSAYNALNIYGDYSYKVQEHAFKFMTGFNQEKYSWQQFYETRAEMINQDLPSISGGVGEVFADDAYSEYSIRSGFYRVNYDFAGKYLLETNGRYDGSSKFPKVSRFGFFPSFSAGWRMSEESFMNWSREYINSLKFRASWGNIGNQNINPYIFVPGMEPYVTSWLVDNKRVYSLKTPSLVSSSFTWEKVETIDFGLDLTMFNNRLNSVFDWYQRDTKGMLADGAELPSVLGTGAPKENVADLRTHGWELAIQWRDRIGQINYNLGFNLYDSKTKITKFDNEAGLLPAYDSSGQLTQYYVGMDVNEQWGYTTDRYYTENDFNTDGTLKDGIARVEGFTPNVGDILYVDYNNDGVINSGSSTLDNPGDQRIIGNRARRYQYGITGGADWKGFALSFILQGVGKRDIWYSNELFWPWYDEFSTLMSSQLDYWTPGNTNAYFPRVYERARGNTSANRQTQTKYKLNGAYLSVKNITLSYTFPKSAIEKYRLNTLSIFTSVEDLYNFNHLPRGMDAEAEVKARGWTYPFLTKWSMGLRIGL
ncbi:TonB-dependent receptor [Petrimonas sp.]|uniref:TonB-dependent receptor n=1 Tax=Petrimonas sp. TaxID=2023866 RepID=UPI003F510436